jgi:enoyl-CoA hydratase
MIRVESRDAVTVVTISRHDRRNAISAAMCHELIDAVSTPARAVVIAADGEVFCSGADLDDRFAEQEAGSPDSFRPAFLQLCRTIASVSSLVIAAVDGPALGAGAQLVAWSDIRIGSASARFAIPAATLGVHVAPRSIARIADVMGMSAAEQLLLMSSTIDAERAHRCGLLHEVVSDARVRADELADELARLAPLTLSGHKAALRAFGRTDLVSPERMTYLEMLEARAFASRDYREGLEARRERRSPVFLDEA